MVVSHGALKFGQNEVFGGHEGDTYEDDVKLLSLEHAFVGFELEGNSPHLIGNAEGFSAFVVFVDHTLADVDALDALAMGDQVFFYQT